MTIWHRALIPGLLALMALAYSAVAFAVGPTQSVSAALTSKAPHSFHLAQLEFNLGLSEHDARRVLSEKGYRDIRITRTSFKNIHAEACLKGIRYEIKVRRLSGEVRRGKQIGKCRKSLNAREIAARLRKQGLDKVTVLAADRGNFTASACDYDKRVQLTINPFGEVLHRSQEGRCERGPKVAEIKRQLQEDGYTRIQVVKKNRQRLVVEACLEGDKVRLRLAADGRIRRHDIIGTCAKVLRPQNIAKHMRELGYRRIKIIDDELPIYKAEACRQNSLMRIHMNRYGEIVSTSRLRKCSPSLNRQQIVAMLRRRGATRVEVISQDSRGFRAEACYRLERRRYRIDLYGGILNREVIGRCGQARRLSSILKDFRSRGMRDVRILVEGCRRGRRLQIELDQYGDEINRQRIGRC